MQNSNHPGGNGCRVETLESRRMLSLAAASVVGVVSPEDLIGQANVTAARSARTAAGWREAGALDQNKLPAPATVNAVAGRVFDFTRATFAKALPVGLKSVAREVLLPTPLGGFARFAVTQTALLAPNIAKQNPDVATYRAIGIDDPSAIAQFDLTGNGLHATVLSPNGGWAISPVTEYSADVRAGRGQYACFFLAHDPVMVNELLCGVDSALDEHDAHYDDEPIATLNASTGPTRYTMRIAVAGNGEWTALAGGTQASGFNTIVTAVNAADLLFKKEFNIGFTLVSGQSLVYTDAATDPYTNTSANTMLGQNQTNVDTVIGPANYDIGHVFTTSGGGVASLSGVGVNGNKARGVSGNSPQTSAFQPTFWHEMGHQFGSHHTWNHTNAEYSGQRASDHAYEPGPGSTLMSYGGFSMFPGNFVAARDHYYHAKSMERITNHVQTGPGANAGTDSPTGNTTPTVNAGVDRTIPTNTPFELTGTGSDTEPLTFTWEQYDLGDEDEIGVDDGNGPLFRSRLPNASPTRMFPELADILANRSDADERLPQVARTADPLTFRFTARDGLGGANFDAMEVTVQNTGAAFAITSHNTGPVTFQRNSRPTINWNVAGTTAAQFNAANVTIYISYDNGQTFAPILANTPNDGSAQITIPSNATLTSNARIKVKPEGNIFFDINNTGITIAQDTSLDVQGLTYDFERAQALRIDFNEPINAATLSINDLTVTDQTRGITISSGDFTLAEVPGSDGSAYTFTYSPSGGGVLPDGNYRASIPVGAISDTQGNTNATEVFVTFHVLTADANRDRFVNAADQTIVNNNLGQSNRTYSQGDFNFDGTVNAADQSILDAQLLKWVPVQGAITLATTSGPDVYGFRREAANVFELRQNGSPAIVNRIVTGPNLQVAFNGGDGSDVLELDMSNGTFGAAQFTFNGQGGADSLRYIGQSGADSLTSSIMTTNFNGTIVQKAAVDSTFLNGAGGGDTVSITDTLPLTIVGRQHFASFNLLTTEAKFFRANLAVPDVFVVDSLSMDADSSIDLNDNAMVVNYTGASALAAVQDKINTARNGGAWDGLGITSTAARDNAQHNTTLAAIESADFKSIYGEDALFNGESIDATAVLVKHTYYGDADFNGVVNFDDYARIDTGFSTNRTGWLNGDCDGNGSVNFDDYSLIDLAFNTQSGTL